MRIPRSLKTLLAVCVVATAAAGLNNPAHAGRSCVEYKPDAVTVQKALTLALHTREALEASGAQIALVGRVGRDMSKQGLRYSHMAFALRDHPKGRWLFVHLLNECGADKIGRAHV